MRCPKCQSDYDSGITFCERCGVVLGTGMEDATRDARAEPQLVPEANTRAAHQPVVESGTSIATETTLEPEQLLWGRFTVERLLGRGGMGEVYLATDAFMNNRRVALKVLLPTLLAEPGARARLQREVGSARNLRHPNIVAVHTYFEDKTAIGYDMEYLEGATLQQHLDGHVAGSPFAGDADAARLAPVARLATAVASALDYIHSPPRNLVHRDVKPSNVMITPTTSGRWDDVDVKLLDFGVVSATQDNRLTGIVQPGTIAYMAQEVQEGSPATPSSDIYSFGKMIYLALTGFTPTFNLKPPSSLVQGLPTELDEPLLSCFEPPAGRPSTAIAAVSSMIASTPGVFPPERVVSPTTRTVRGPHPAEPPETSSSSGFVPILGTVGGIVLLVLVVLFGRTLLVGEESGEPRGDVEPPREAEGADSAIAVHDAASPTPSEVTPTPQRDPPQPIEPAIPQPRYSDETSRLVADVDGVDYTVIDLEHGSPRHLFSRDGKFLGDDLTDSESLVLEAVADFDGDGLDDALLSLHPDALAFGAGQTVQKHAFVTYKGEGRFQVGRSFGKWCHWDGKITSHGEGRVVDIDCDDVVKRFACEEGNPVLVTTFDKPELTAILDITMNDLEMDVPQRFPIDLNGDGVNETILCEIRMIDLMCGIYDSAGEQIPGTSWILDRLGVLSSKTNGVSDLVLNRDHVVVWDGTQWADKK